MMLYLRQIFPEYLRFEGIIKDQVESIIFIPLRMNFQIKRVGTARSSNKSTPQRSWKCSTRITSSKKSLAASTASSTFYISTQTQTVVLPGFSRSKVKAKRTMKSILHSNVSDISNLNLTSTSWCLYDSKNLKFVGFREKYQRQIASLTKIMTTLVSIEFYEKYQMNSQLHIKVTENAAKMIGTSADIKYKTWIKFMDLLYGAMLPSGNDAAYLLSEVIGYLHKLEGNKRQYLRNLKFLDITNENTTLYTVEFIKMMNQKAEELGLNSTKFSNPHGLQNALNVSSPKDLIILSHHASKNELFRKIMNKEEHTYQYAEVVQQSALRDQQGLHIKYISKEKKQYIKITKHIWQNTNILLKKGWQGVKTGQTGSAGSCLASLRDGIFIVVLNCKDNDARFSETERIFNWYTTKNKNQSIFD